MSKKNKSKKISSLITLSSLVSQAAYGIDLNSKVKNTDKRFFETLPSLEKTEGVHLGVTAGQSTNPLIFKRNNGEEVVLVDGLQFFEANYLQSFSDKFQLGVMIPTAKPFGVMTPLTEEKFFLGDILIEPRYYITDNLLFIPVFYLPTGDFDNQMGSKSGAYGAKLATEINGKNTKMAFQIGALFAPNDIQGDIDNTLRLQAGVGLDWQLSESFHWLSEMYLEKSKNNMPLEALTFLEYRKKDFGVRAGVGSGSLITTGSNEVKGMVGFTMNFGGNSSSKETSGDKGSNINQSNGVDSDSSVIEFNKVEKEDTEAEYYLDNNESVNPTNEYKEKEVDEVDVDALFEDKIDDDLNREPQSTQLNYVEERAYQALSEVDNFTYFMQLTKRLMNLDGAKKDNYVVLKSFEEEKIEKEVKAAFSENKKNNDTVNKYKQELSDKIFFQEERLLKSHEVLKYTVKTYMDAIKNNNLEEVKKQIIEMRWAKQVTNKRKDYLLSLQKEYNNKFSNKNIIPQNILNSINNKEANQLVNLIDHALDKDHSELIVTNVTHRKEEKIFIIPQDIKVEEIIVSKKEKFNTRIKDIGLEELKANVKKETNDLANDINIQVTDASVIKGLATPIDKVNIEVSNLDIDIVTNKKDFESVKIFISESKDNLARKKESKENNLINVAKVSPKKINNKEIIVASNYKSKLVKEYNEVLKDIDLNKKTLNKKVDLKSTVTTIVDFNNNDKVMADIDTKNFFLDTIPLMGKLKNTLESFSINLQEKIALLKKEKKYNQKQIEFLVKKEYDILESLYKLNSEKKRKVAVVEKLSKPTLDIINLNQNKLDYSLKQSLIQIEMNISKMKNINNFNIDIAESDTHKVNVENLENIFEKSKLEKQNFKKQIAIEEIKMKEDLYQLEKKEIEKYIVDLKELKKENSNPENISKEILKNELYLVRLKEHNKQQSIDVENKKIEERTAKLANQERLLDLKKQERNLLELNNLKLKDKKPAAMGRVRIDTVEIDQKKERPEVSAIEEINSKLIEEEAKLRSAKIEEEKLIKKNRDMSLKENAIALELKKINSEIKEIDKEKKSKAISGKKIEADISSTKNGLAKEMSDLQELIMIKKNKLLIDMKNKEETEEIIEVKKEIQQDKKIDSDLEQLNMQLKSLENKNKMLKSEIEELEMIEVKEELSTDGYSNVKEEVDSSDDSDFGTIYENEGGMRELTPDDY